MTYKITRTKNGNANDIANALTLEQAQQKLLFFLQDYGYGVYDNETDNVYHEVSKKIIAEKGDMSVGVHDGEFNIIEE